MSGDRAEDVGERDALDELLEHDDDTDVIDETEDGDESGDDEAPQEERAPEEEPPARPQRTREQRAVESWRKRAREQEAENKRLTEALLGRQQQQQLPQPSPDPYRQAELDRQEAERVQMMAPHEVAAYYAQRTRNEIQQQMLRSHLETRELMDRQSFDLLKRSDPLAQRFASQVEDALIFARNQGMNPSREQCLDALVGREMRQKATRQAERQRVQGRRRIASQTTRPQGSAASSTAASPRGQRRADDSDEALLARLKGVTIGDAW